MILDLFGKKKLLKELEEKERKEIEHINGILSPEYLERACIPEDYLYAILCLGRLYYDSRGDDGNLGPGVIENFDAFLSEIVSAANRKGITLIYY